MTDQVTNESNADVQIAKEMRDALEQQASMLGISFHPNISDEKLSQRIKEKLEETQPEPTTNSAKISSEADLRRKMQDEATKLVRVIISCNNPLKKAWEGEVFKAGNRYLGTVTRYVPFDREWHVPQILLNVIKERMYQAFVTKVDDRTQQEYTRAFQRKEFVVEVLDQMSEAELKELARRQAARRGEDV